MGIRGLTQLCTNVKAKRHIPCGHITAEKFKVWAIDVSLFLYRARCLSASHALESSFGRTHRRPHRFRNVVNDVPLEKSHLVGIMDVASQLISSKITPVFIFDGEPPPEKAATLAKRKAEKIKLVEKISNLQQNIQSTIDESDEELFPSNAHHIKKLEVELENEQKKLSAIVLEPQHIYETKMLCDILGLPYIQSRGEAESTCIALQRQRLIDAIYTADSDVLVFGSPKMVRRIIKDEYVDIMSHDFLIQELGLTHDQFVCMCILVGCDYCESYDQIHNIQQAIQITSSFSSTSTSFSFEEFFDSLPTKVEGWSQRAKRAFQIYNQVGHIDIDRISEPNLPAPQDHVHICNLLRQRLHMDGGYVHRVVDQIIQSFIIYKSDTRPSTAIPLGPPVATKTHSHHPHKKVYNDTWVREAIQAALQNPICFHHFSNFSHVSLNPRECHGSPSEGTSSGGSSCDSEPANPRPTDP